jgi:hypothetical protein
MNFRSRYNLYSYTLFSGAGGKHNGQVDAVSSEGQHTRNERAYVI